jgi:hypothetical protein
MTVNVQASISFALKAARGGSIRSTWACPVCHQSTVTAEKLPKQRFDDLRYACISLWEHRAYR